jgi:hypothetical protein
MLEQWKYKQARYATYPIGVTTHAGLNNKVAQCACHCLLLVVLILSGASEIHATEKEQFPVLDLQPGGFLFSRDTNEFVQRIHLTNQSDQPIGGQLFLLVEGVPTELQVQGAKHTIPKSLPSKNLNVSPSALFVPVVLHKIQAGQTVTKYLRFKKRTGPRRKSRELKTPTYRIRVINALPNS